MDRTGIKDKREYFKNNSYLSETDVNGNYKLSEAVLDLAVDLAENRKHWFTQNEFMTYFRAIFGNLLNQLSLLLTNHQFSYNINIVSKKKFFVNIVFKYFRFLLKNLEEVTTPKKIAYYLDLLKRSLWEDEEKEENSNKREFSSSIKNEVNLVINEFFPCKYSRFLFVYIYLLVQVNNTLITEFLSQQII